MVWQGLLFFCVFITKFAFDNIFHFDVPGRGEGGGKRERMEYARCFEEVCDKKRTIRSCLHTGPVINDAWLVGWWEGAVNVSLAVMLFFLLIAA